MWVSRSSRSPRRVVTGIGRMVPQQRRVIGGDTRGSGDSHAGDRRSRLLPRGDAYAKSHRTLPLALREPACVVGTGTSSPLTDWVDPNLIRGSSYGPSDDPCTGRNESSRPD